MIRMYVGSPEVISKKFSTKMLRNRHPSIKSNWRVTTRTGFVAIALVLVSIEVTSLAFAQDEGRQIAGKPGSRDRGEGIPFDPSIYESVPEEASSSSHFVSVPDRWGQFYKGRWYDPYNQNRWKGDLPIFGKPGEEWFIELSATSDTMVEQHKLPLPVGGASTNQPGSVNVFGGGQQSVVPLIMSFVLPRFFR
jgi:hypothetical protein